MSSTKRMFELEEKFEEELLKRAGKVRASKPKYEKPARPVPVHHHHHHHHGGCRGHSESGKSYFQITGLNKFLLCLFQLY